MFRIKLIAILTSLSLMTTTAFAGIGIGFSGIGGLADTSGSETLKSTSVKTTHSEKEPVAIPEVYLQWDILGSGWTIGTSYVPVSAELGAKEKKKNDWNGAAGYTLVTNKAQAELKDHYRIYAETPGIFGTGFYAGIGWSSVTLETNESLGSGATYGNKDIDGVSYELGFKKRMDSGILIKIAGSLTEYDDMSLKSAAESGTSAQHTIEADPEVLGVKLSIGYQF